MARLVINTIGSTGDLLPFVALGKGLQQRGHSVVFAVNRTMHPTIRGASLDVVDCGPPLGETEAREMLHMFDGSNHLRQLTYLMRDWLIPSTRETYPQLLEACRGADALIATSIQFAAPLVCEKLGIHSITVSLNPLQFSTRYEAPMGWANSRFHFWNALGWRAAKFFMRSKFLRPLNAVRRELGFKPQRGAPTMDDLSDELILLATSEQFSPPQPDWPPQIKMTGFWYYDGREQSTWQPPDELRRFIERGSPPVVLSLGSMVQKDPHGVVRMHVDALRNLDQRVIVQQGWARLSVEQVRDLQRGDVAGVGFVPHDWLFDHARAIIHHGGIGTTARALRHGRPMLLEPHGFDQPYNARHIVAMGVGQTVHAHRVNAAALRQALPEVLTAETRLKAEAIGAKLRQEDGVAVACAHIEGLLSK